VGPLDGDNQSLYEFIAWDVENPECQNYTTLEAADCGPITSFGNFTVDSVFCITSNIAAVTINFTHENETGLTFDLYDDDGNFISTWLYSSLPVFLSNFTVNGAAPITVTVCDHNNEASCETFVVDAIDCTPNNCEIFNITIDPECLTSNFVVHLDFDTDNPASDSFTVTGNSLNYGTFGYNQLPIILGPLNGNSSINWEFVIRDSELETCVSEEILGVYHCPPPCDILSMDADAFLCNGNDAYYLEVDMDIEGQGHGGFSLFSESSYYGTFQYDALPITIPSFVGSGNFVDQVTVCDNDHLGCCATISYEALLCAGCIIYNLEATPLPCNEEEQIYISIDFDFQNVSADGFSISGNGEQYGDFSYDQVPVLLGPFPGDGSYFLEFVVTDLANEFCFDATEIGILPCDSICNLSGLEVETGECTGTNTFILHLNFDFEGVTGIGFDLFANGDFYDFYSYDDLPLTILEFPSNGDGLDTIRVSDNDNDSCYTTLVFESPNCECSIYETSVQTLACTSDSTFAISVEFFSQNLPGNFVDVFLDGIFIGSYNIENIPFIVENIPEGDGPAILMICANDLGSCCDDVLIELMNCEDAQCVIWDLFAEIGDCNSDTTYLLDIVFNHLNLPSDSVNIWANDHFIGKFLINPDFIRIEHFPVFDGNTTTITVCAVGNDDCCDTYTFETPDCTPGGCEIWDLVADPGDCLTDSTYVLVIEYNSENVPGDSVTVTANGNFIGTFIDPDEHIVIEHFPWFDGDIAVLTLCSFAFPDCCDSYEFEIPNCPGGGDCNIEELQFGFGDCQTDSTYILEVSFQYSNLLETDSVIITANDEFIGQYQLGLGLIIIENFPVFPNNLTVVTVCAVSAPDCCSTGEFETPNCEGGGDCHIYDLIVDVGDCQSDSTYILIVDFQFNNLPTDSVTITANEENIGTFHVHEGHIILEHFPVFPGNLTEIHVCALNAPDCCDVFVFETPNCEGGDECHLFDLVTHVGDCLTDSTYVLVVDFEFNNLHTDSVLITANEEFIGQFHVHEGHIVIEHFPVFPGDNTVIHVCALGAPDCCDVYEFETPNCEGGGTCHIYDLFAETGECTSDSTFLLDIVFHWNNLPTDSVLIYANDHFIGTFHTNPDFIRIEHFPIFDGDNTNLVVCALGAPDCCDTYSFDTPSCGGGKECSIYDVSVQTFDCSSDSTFGVVINFQYQNISAGGFDVYTGDSYLGFFNFDQVPIETNQFPANGSGEYVVTICESDNSDCCTSFEFEGPVCGEGFCDINNLEWSLTPCDSAGNFFFILDFNFQNVGTEGFSVVGNGNDYGNFSYEDLPIEIGPFESNNTVFEFLVTDNQNNVCFDFVEPGNVECLVATTEINHDEIFDIFNNGSLPGILVKKDLMLSLFNSKGKMLFSTKPLEEGIFFELNSLPSGFYIATIVYEGNIWPVKLVKGSY